MALTTDTTASALQKGNHDDFLTLGPVELRVTDAERASRFWRDLIGLADLGEVDGAEALGSAGEPLVLLRETATRPAAQGRSGLYHVAIHYPTTFEFGRVLARLAAARQPISIVDHLFSQAFYLRDPDGIGVELTYETPWRMREMRVDAVKGLHAVDQNGQIRSPSEPLDVTPLLTEIEGSDIEAPAESAYVGHVHLSVPDLGAAVAFYRDQLGFIEHVNEPDVGLADLRAGGDFTHRLALNTFHGPGIQPAPADTAGMDRFTIRYRQGAQLERVEAQLGVDAGAARTGDPAGNEIALVA